MVKSLRLELHTLVAGAYRRKESIEKSVNFLQPGGTFSCGRGDQGNHRLTFRQPFPGIPVSQAFPRRAKREYSSLLRSSHVAPLAQFLDSN
jgi:hypothetical protein